MNQRLNKTKSQTRVSINTAFHRWRQLMGLKGLKSDVMVAEFLLNRCFFLFFRGILLVMGIYVYTYLTYNLSAFICNLSRSALKL